jgi:hypothetical protein
MGFHETSARLFYGFCLDGHVPSDHMLRSIGRHLNLDDVRQRLKPFYSSTGRPSIDPELMIRMSPRTPTSSALSRATNGKPEEIKAKDRSSRARVSCDAGRRRFRRGVPCDSEVHFAVRSGGSVKGAPKGHAFFA